MNARHFMAAMATAALLGCGGGDDDGTGPAPSGPTVTAGSNNTFSPSTITIQVNESVTWVFQSVDHNVVFTTGGAPAAIGNSRNKNVSRQFTTAGTFPYFCSLHSNMNGTVVVQ